MSSSEELGIIRRIPHLCRFNSTAIAIPQPIESSGEDQKGKFSGTDTGTCHALALALVAISQSWFLLLLLAPQSGAHRRGACEHLFYELFVWAKKG